MAFVVDQLDLAGEIIESDGFAVQAVDGLQIARQVLVVAVQIVIMPYIIDRPLVCRFDELPDRGRHRHGKRTYLGTEAFGIFREVQGWILDVMPVATRP